MNQQQIKKEDLIGEGTYGKVYRAKDEETNQYLALKEIEFKNAEEGITSTTIREIALLKQLASHPNIVKLFDVVMAQNTLTMVFEYCDQDLKQYIDNYNKSLSNNSNNNKSNKSNQINPPKTINIILAIMLVCQWINVQDFAMIY